VLLLLLCVAGSSTDKAVLACNELEQLTDNTEESLEQSLVRRGEMTPFGTVVNTAVEVNMYHYRYSFCLIGLLLQSDSRLDCVTWG